MIQQNRYMASGLVKFITGDAFYFYFTGFSKYGDTGDDGGITTAIIFKRGAFFDIDTIEGDGEGGGYRCAAAAFQVSAEDLGFDGDAVFTGTELAGVDDFFCFYDAGAFRSTIYFYQIPRRISAFIIGVFVGSAFVAAEQGIRQGNNIGIGITFIGDQRVDRLRRKRARHVNIGRKKNG